MRLTAQSLCPHQSHQITGHRYLQHISLKVHYIQHTCRCSLFDYGTRQKPECHKGINMHLFISHQFSTFCTVVTSVCFTMYKPQLKSASALTAQAVSLIHPYSGKLIIVVNAPSTCTYMYMFMYLPIVMKSMFSRTPYNMFHVEQKTVS